MIEVRLNCVGPDRFEGELGADDAHERVVHLHFVNDDTGRVQLWQRYGWGKNPCGHGSLQRVGDGDGELWLGTVEDTVHRQRWRVTGALQSGELIFENDGGHSPVASVASSDRNPAEG